MLAHAPRTQCRCSCAAGMTTPKSAETTMAGEATTADRACLLQRRCRGDAASTACQPYCLHEDAGALGVVTMEFVGISLVRNEDRFVEQALLNIAWFCDRIFVADHMSVDRTPAILERLEREVDHLQVRRVKHSAESHELIADLAGTDTWILSVDGDELYDPVGLARLRQELECGAHRDVFRLR